MIKSQISDIETLKFKLDSKEDTIKDLKRQIKLKVCERVDTRWNTEGLPSHTCIEFRHLEAIQRILRDIRNN